MLVSSVFAASSDADRDGDVDLRDAGAFQNCFSGSGGEASIDCSLFDCDADQDVDHADYVFFVSNLTGPVIPLPNVLVDPPESPTTSTTMLLTGTATGTSFVKIVGGLEIIFAPVVAGQFIVFVDLHPNVVNNLFVIPLALDGTPGPPAAVSITNDQLPPSLFIDFPADGAELTKEVIDVAGRVGDLLSGFMGLTVLVNGVQAVVDVGIGNNGTFLAPGVPLVVGPNVITAVAIDALGNKITKEIMVTRVEISPDAPRMHVTSGNERIGQVGSLLGQPIVVQVTHPDGEPFVNKLVTFDVTRSNGRLSADVMGEGAMMLQLFTDAVGEARAFWRVGFDAGCGNNRVEVTSGDVVGRTFFGASATPAPAAQINVGSGNNQRAETGAPAPEPLRVWVSDACNGVSGIPVTFSVTLGDGKVNGQNEATVPTTATGHAEVAFTMGSNPGHDLVEATFPTNSRLPDRFVAFGLSRDVAQQTSFIGTVLNNAEQRVQGATCSLNAGGVPLPSTQTDINGMFQFDDIPSLGPADLFIDGASAFHVGGEGGTDIPLGSFPALHYTPLLIPNAVNALSTPVLLPPLNPANALVFDNT